MRELALKHRGDKAQVFLSVREAAKRFHAPRSSIAAVYGELAKERLLIAVRGSRTLLAGRGETRTLTVRGVLGMPLSMPRAYTMQHYGRCFIETREALHRRGFVITPLSFDEREIECGALIARAKKESIETLVWVLPSGIERDSPARLRDAGIAWVGLTMGGSPGIKFRYEISRARAIAEIMRAWRADPAIERAIIARTGYESAAEIARMEDLRRLIEAEKMECKIAAIPGGHISTFLRTSCATERAGVVLPPTAAGLLGWRPRDTVVSVLQSCRVALVAGPMELLLLGNLPEAKVDLITVNWRRVGERIAKGLFSGAALDESKTTVFEADAQLRAALPGAWR